jgi:hypothetical protein
MLPSRSWCGIALLAGLLFSAAACQKGAPVPTEEERVAQLEANRAADKAAYLKDVAAGAVSFDLKSKVPDDSWLEPLAGKPIVRLDITSHPIYDKGLGYLAGNTTMKVLYLEGTKITDQGMPVLATMTELEDLTLNGEVQDGGLASLANLTKLRNLLLSDKVTDQGLPHLTKLTELETLGPLGPGVSGAGIDALFPLQKLVSLQFYNSNITDADLDKLAKFPQLGSISLVGTKITDAGLMKLTKLPKLKVIMVGSTSVTPEGVEKAKKARPDLEIIR